MRELETQCTERTEENRGLKAESKKAVEDMNEACQAMVKLDEARVVMNKLLGPQGPLSMAERHKFFTVAKDEDYDTATGGGAIKVKDYNTAQNQGNRQMQQQNAAYFNGKQDSVAGDGGEDEFWYQTPKGVGS